MPDATTDTTTTRRHEKGEQLRNHVKYIESMRVIKKQRCGTMSFSQESILWLHLVFPRVVPCMLLVLRLVCKAFCKRLTDATTLWIPYTIERPFMSYAERLQGWRGILAARAREQRTLENCETGSYFKVSVDSKRYRHMGIVANRLLCCVKHDIVLFCCFTGEIVSSIAIRFNRHRLAAHTICDRWVPLLHEVDGKPVLVDCVSCRVVEIPTSVTYPESWTISGPCIAYCAGVYIFVYDISGNESTQVSHVATIDMQMMKGTFVGLCSGGRSWVHLHKRDNTYRVVETRTNCCLRTVTLRKFLS